MGWGCFWLFGYLRRDDLSFPFLMELMCEVVMFVFSLSLPARLVNQEISFTRCLHLTILTVSLNSISRIEVEADLVTRFQGFPACFPNLRFPPIIFSVIGNQQVTISEASERSRMFQEYEERERIETVNSQKSLRMGFQ
jgi:hypothetical protein